jgi:preprotein translocase subunit SecG
MSTYLRNLVTDGLLLVVVILLVEQGRRVDGGGRVVDGGDGRGHVGRPGNRKIHRMLQKVTLHA